MSLIDQLTNEHQALQKLLTEASRAGLDTDSGQQKMGQVKTMLLAHLKKEDTELYPELKKLEDAQAIAHSFQDEMTEISKAAVEFFTFFESRPDDKMKIAHEFGAFVGALKKRIIREEVTLYPLYEKHVK